MSKSITSTTQPESAATVSHNTLFPTAASMQAAVFKAPGADVAAAKKSPAKTSVTTKASAAKAGAAAVMAAEVTAPSKPPGLAAGTAKTRSAALSTPVPKTVPGKARSSVKPVLAKPAAVKMSIDKVSNSKVPNGKTAAARSVAPKSTPRTVSAPAAATASSGIDEVKDKLRKPKLVRDSFTMPEQEYAVLGQVKKACLKAGFEIKKSDLLRIGVALISQIDLATLQNVLLALPQLKTGRPKKG